MELVVWFVFLGGFALCAGLVYVISVFGVQGETFEEAVEKQRNQNKEKKKEKKPATEKKKKQKKGKEGKDAKNAQDTEDEPLLVDPQGEVVECVFVEPVKEPEPAPVVVKKEEPKPKKEKKKAAPAPAPAPVVEEEVVEETAIVAEAKKVVEAVQKKAVEAVQKAAAEAEAIEAQIEAVPEAKPEKKKIEIVEVAEAKVEEVQEEKKKKKAGKEKAKKAKGHYDEILSVIRQSPLSATEAQGIVDILLLKQTGKDEDISDDWIEPGKENETKKLTRQLGELQAELEEEKVKGTGLEKKMAALRKELNEGKTVLAGHRREVEDITSKKNAEINSLNTRLQQATTQLNSSTALNRQLESNQSHYQATINTLQTQLAQVAVGTPDTKVAAELEELKKSSSELAAANSSIQQQLATKTEEVEQLAAKLSAAAEEKEQLAAKLSAATEQLEEVKQHGDSQMSAKQQFDSQLSAVTAAKQQIQLELSVLKEKLSAKEVENSRLLEENERLSEQVASSVERPAAEGEEDAKVNGHQEVEVKVQSSSDANEWEEKYAKLTVQLQHIESRQSEVVAELEASKAELEAKRAELEANMAELEAKRVELEANKGEMEAAKGEIEQLRAKNDADVSRLGEYQTSTLAVFSRLFPSITSTDLQEVEKEAKEFIQNLEKSASEVSTEDQSEDVSKLEAQVAHYKTVLAQTEDMLTSLQTSVESAEGEWKKKLEVVEREGSEHKKSLETLQTKNSELQGQVDTLNNKIKELEGLKGELDSLKGELKEEKDGREALKGELEGEREGREVLAKKCTELQQLLAAGQTHINNHKEGDLSNGVTEQA